MFSGINIFINSLDSIHHKLDIGLLHSKNIEYVLLIFNCTLHRETHMHRYFAKSGNYTIVKR